MKASISRTIIAVMLLVAAGCVSDSNSPYEDPTEGRGRTTDLWSYDFQMCTAAMVDSLLADKRLEKNMKESFPNGKTPTVAFGFYNRTYQLSATDKLKRSMYNTLETKLFKSGRFDIVDSGVNQELIDMILSEIDNPLVNVKDERPFKQGASIDYVIEGVIVEFREGDGRVNDCYYKMTMKMYSVRTRKIVWIDEKEIRKVSTRPMVGW